eukprot:Tbor_TRINITY_DN5807_c3_g9::TRINITY_DN5807_c3_g9_i1::g.5985::m.5985/K02874/RP-L14, MRPL14, rplN; large subunit ribosomal protein L14
MLHRTLCWLASATEKSVDSAKKGWFRHHVIVKRVAGYRSRWGKGDEGVNAGVPFMSQVKLHCVDNTNCKHARIIANAVHERFHHCKIMPVVAHRVSIMRFKSGRGAGGRQKVKPGTIYWGVLLTRRQYNTRWSGLTTNFDRNTCILTNDQRVPVGTRVMYCAGRHVNNRVHLKAAVMANFFV